MVITRYINISREHAREVVKDRSRREAYAMAVVITNNFSSSRLKAENSLITGLMSLMSIGHGRAARTLDNALLFGYVRWDGNQIVANKLYEGGERVFKIKVTNNRMNLNQGVNLIRKIALADQIKNVQYWNDLKKQVHHKINVEKDVSGAKRRVRKDGLALVLDRKARKKGEFDLTPSRISMKTLAETIGMSEPSARDLIDSMVKDGMLDKRYQFEMFKFRDNKQKEKFFSEYESFKENEVNSNRFRIIGGQLYYQLANLYSLLSNHTLSFSYQ